MQKLKWEYKTDLEKAGLKVIKILHSSGFQAFWVGGIVRNFLLKRESDNLDIATDALPDQVALALSRKKIFVKPIGKQFGSILAIVNGQKIEITTFRREGFYSDNRHPDEVEFIKEYLADAKRRDFTINALYFDPVEKIVYDPALGLKDLKANILRFVGDPRKRIDEDGLRMLRGVRLATELGFKLERNSFAGIKTRSKYIQGISGERIKVELDKILLSPNRAAGLQLLSNSGLLKFILPELEQLKNVYHKSELFHLEGSMFEHSVRAAGLVESNNLDLIYAALFHDIGKTTKPVKIKAPGKKGWRLSFPKHTLISGEIFEKYIKQLKFPRTSADHIKYLILHHDDRAFFKDYDEARQIRYFLECPDPAGLIEIWRVDSYSNLRLENGKKIWRESATLPVALRILKKIETAKVLFKLASGDLIMKHSTLKPGQALGQKIEDVKIEIVLGRIKNEKDLKTYLST